MSNPGSLPLSWLFAESELLKRDRLAANDTRVNFDERTLRKTTADHILLHVSDITCPYIYAVLTKIPAC